MSRRSRAQSPQTLGELQRLLEQLYPEAEVEIISAEGAAAYVSEHGSEGGRNDLVADSAAEQLVAVLRDEAGQPSNSLSLRFKRPVARSSVRFGRCLVKTFNDDVRAAPDANSTGELWLSLQQTRHSRAIGKFCPFHTELFIKWLRTFEAASSLRYEGQPFSARLILTKQMEWVRQNRALSFVRFPKPMALAATLFEEKWARALAANGDVTLVGFGHDRGVAGMLTVEGRSERAIRFVAPHHSLSALCSALVPGTMAFITAATGDLHVLLADGTNFVKSQGYWRLSSSKALEAVISEDVLPEVTPHLLRIAFDLSYEGKGGLFCVIADKAEIRELVPDHSDIRRSNRTLRATSKKLSLGQPGHHKMIKNIATIDGAVVIDQAGTLLDAACMIGDPTREALARIGLSGPKRFPGARTTAAWNASVLGTAIKISEDGPITVFRRGEQLLQTG